MNRITFALSANVNFATLMLGCGAPGPQPVAVEVSCDDFARAFDASLAASRIARKIAVPVGTPITLTLCANPSTGYRWGPVKIADARILQQIDHQVEASGTNLPGASVKEIWTFQVLQPGTSTVSLDYSRPWTGGEKGIWQFTLTVTASSVTLGDRVQGYLQRLP